MVFISSKAEFVSVQIFRGVYFQKKCNCSVMDANLASRKIVMIVEKFLIYPNFAFERSLSIQDTLELKSL